MIALALQSKIGGDALFVVPLTNKETTWLDSIEQYLPECGVYATIDEYRRGESPKILLLHYEQVPKLAKRLARIKFDYIMYDESQRIKSRTTKASRASFKLYPAEFKIILSGTPIDSTPGDIWSQFNFLDPEILGPWKAFEEYYYSPVDDKKLKRLIREKGFKHPQTQWELRVVNLRKRKREFMFDRLPDLVTEIEPYALRIDRRVLNLPPPKIKKVFCDMKPIHRGIYDRIRRHMVSRLPNITTPLKITQVAKLCQITGGFVYDNDGELYLVGTAKLLKLRDLLNKLDSPVVVFAKYRAEVEAIAGMARKLGRVAVLTGATKKTLRPDIIRDFQRGRYDFIICQQRTGGVGIDLFRSNKVVFYSFNYSFIDFDQALARVHRRGQTKEVDVYILIARHSIDEKISQVLVNKQTMAKSVLQQLTREIALTTS